MPPPPPVHRTPERGQSITSGKVSWTMSPQTPNTPEFQYPIKSYQSETQLTPKESQLSTWCKSGALQRAMLRQLRRDPDEIFGSFPKTINLQDVFQKIKPRNRGSSNDWSKDRLQSNEESEYKKKMFS
eukprot:TRINITY_DN11179_c0_g1_i1.p1 TRINITY_DN11179_c0_g1~~TRINITY_DN11179_c0_g1_i1.p1  ORF type:complete len:128 (+),score=23.46 TRINITY_DN11179_c0_g1_i1:143-526(+)